METRLSHNNFKPVILHQNEVGQISQCEECGEITIMIKSIMFFCNVNMLEDIRKMITSITSRIDNHIFIVNDEQKVVLCTIHENVKLCFTIEEMLDLNELLDQSLHMIEVNKLLMN